MPNCPRLIKARLCWPAAIAELHIKQLFYDHTIIIRQSKQKYKLMMSYSFVVISAILTFKMSVTIKYSHKASFTGIQCRKQHKYTSAVHLYKCGNRCFEYDNFLLLYTFSVFLFISSDNVVIIKWWFDMQLVTSL